MISEFKYVQQPGDAHHTKIQQPVGAPEINQPTKKTKWWKLAVKLN